MTSMIPEPQMPVTAPKSKPGSSDHVLSDDGEAGLESRTFDPDSFYCPGAASCSRGDLCTLERRPGRARSSEQPVFVPQDQLGIGPNIDEQLQTLGTVWALRQHPPAASAPT